MSNLLFPPLVFGIAVLMTHAGCYQAPRVSAADERRALTLIDEGVMLLRQRRLDQADSVFHLAYELAQTAEALDGLGCVAFLRGQPELAEKYYRAAVKINPKSGRTYANLALLYESYGLSESAGETYRIALKRAPADYRSRNNFAGYLFDNSRGQPVLEARDQLYKAKALAGHSLIDDNIKRTYE